MGGGHGHHHHHMDSASSTSDRSSSLDPFSIITNTLSNAGSSLGQQRPRAGPIHSTGTLVWLGFSGSGAGGTYYKTIAELAQMGPQAYGKRLRVGGDVETGAIQRVGHEVCFVLMQDKQVLKVAYSGNDPLPDTFRDGAQALRENTDLHMLLLAKTVAISTNANPPHPWLISWVE